MTAPRYFVDANIILDALMMREHEPMQAAELIDMGYRRTIQLMVTPMTLGFVMAMLQKKRSSKKPGPQLNMIRSMMHDLLLNIDVIPTTKADFLWSLKSNFHDLEDGAQYASAMGSGRFDGIVTRDGDYKDRTVPPVMTAAQALLDAKEKTGVKRKKPH